MSKLEKEVAARIRRGKINNAVISTLAVSGLIAIGLLAPNVLGAMGRLGLINPSQRRQNIQRSLTRLIRGNYVNVVHGYVKLTPKGDRYAALLGKGKLVPKKPKRWDGKWRVLIFDIPERRRKTRTQVRLTLKHLGFIRLQDSVWIYPYDCEDLITLFKVDMRVGKDLLYLIVDQLEYDSQLRTYFKLH
ncbi:MAG: CRISPR-associated endonuclease Cas2 [Patescibacteria group bacterium]